MPYKDPEIRRAKAREYSNRYNEKNQDKVNQRSRELRSEDPERHRGYEKKYHDSHREQRNEYSREYSAAKYAEDPEPQRAASRLYRSENRDQVREKDNERYWSGGKREKMRVWRLKFKHDMTPEDLAAMWEDQQGLCYLCGKDLNPDRFVIEHDHSCCPPEQSCKICRRGLACPNCNSSIGLAGDDPARLRQMADALELAMKTVEQRKAAPIDS